MKVFWLLFGFIPCIPLAQIVHPSNSPAYLQNEVAKVYVTMNPLDFTTMVGDSLGSTYEFPADFIYECSSFVDTVQNVG
ncbi:MAG: hypothetical protein EBU82_04170, partial [Flavobacteriia bacterium]|nr:hypothetical protein [Flavobacteriia bacterium]